MWVFLTVDGSLAFSCSFKHEPFRRLAFHRCVQELLHNTNSMQYLHLNMNSTCLVRQCTVALRPPHPQQHTHTHACAHTSSFLAWILWCISNSWLQLHSLSEWIPMNWKRLQVFFWTTWHYSQPRIASWTNLIFHVSVFKVYFHVKFNSRFVCLPLPSFPYIFYFIYVYYLCLRFYENVSFVVCFFSSLVTNPNGS